MKNTNKLYESLIAITLGFSLISTVSADDFDLFPLDNSNSGDNSFYKDDGSLVIIKGAKDSGLIVRGTDEGTEQEYYVVPKDDGVVSPRTQKISKILRRMQRDMNQIYELMDIEYQVPNTYKENTFKFI